MTNSNHYKIYNSKQWKSIRRQRLNNNPLCECCLLEDKTTPAQEVDHIISIVDRSGVIYPEYNVYNNTMSLCKEHHRRVTHHEYKLRPKLIQLLDNPPTITDTEYITIKDYKLQYMLQLPKIVVFGSDGFPIN